MTALSMTSRRPRRHSAEPAPAPSTPPPDRRGLHRRVGGLSLIGAPLLLLGSEAAYRGTNSPQQMISDAAAHPTAILASNVLLLASSALLVPAAFAILHLARDRGRRLATAGAVLAVLGALGHAAAVGFTSVVLETPPGNRPEMIGLLDRVNHSSALLPVAVCILAFALCLPLLIFGAWRAGLTRLWAPLAVLAAVAVEFSGLGDGVAAGLVKEGLAVLALGSIGWRLLQSTDQAWDADLR